MHQCFMMSWLAPTKKEYNHNFKSKDKDCRLEHDYKNLKDSYYHPKRPDDPKQPDQPEQPDQPDQLEQVDQRFWPWIKRKDEYNKSKDQVYSVKDNELKTDYFD